MMESHASTSPDGSQRAVVSGDRVSVAPESIRVPVPHGPDESAASVHVERAAGRVTAIEVRCPCGQLHRLICEYDS